MPYNYKINENDMEIIDNFLREDTFQSISNSITGHTFPWFFNETVDYVGQQTDNYQFIHNFLRLDAGQYGISQGMQFVIPIIEELKPVHLLKIKANLNVRGDGNEIGDFHRDVGVDGAKTAIFYLNTNNGCTEFKDGQKIKSVANRMVIFDSDKSHRGISCTDEKCRILINFNYIPHSDKYTYLMDSMM